MPVVPANSITTMTLGFPRLGPKRELKFGLEKYWKGAIDQAELRRLANEMEESNWKVQAESSIDQIGVGFFSLYDHVLDWSQRLGCIPPRFKNLPKNKDNDLDRFFAMARGCDGGIGALDMTKWFDTNYHYLVPELSDAMQPQANFGQYLDRLERAASLIGKDRAMPIVLGPLTYVSLAKRSNVSIAEFLQRLWPLYRDLLDSISDLGFSSVQIHEPIFVQSVGDTLLPLIKETYGVGNTAGKLTHAKLKFHLVTYFDDVDPSIYKWFLQSSFSGISLDFTRGDNLSLLKTHGFVEGKTLGAGLVDGRSVWKVQPAEVKAQLDEIKALISKYANTRLIVQPSCSLQHLPYTITCETNLRSETNGLYGALSFAVEKLAEVVALKDYAINAASQQPFWNSYAESWQTYTSCNPRNAAVMDQLNRITPADYERSEKFSVRRKKQMTTCPLLATTTIGSFPQTREIRRLRTKLKKGEISREVYNAEIDKQIAYNIGLQEALGLDILVHGEPERTDMVEYFGEKLHGYAFTQNGWVQSYGSRCVRPPIVFADLTRASAMTVREFVVAQELTAKPVKGMLTGPVTILNWSFARKDITRREQAMQIALCLREEVLDLEHAGCSVIQLDEPALREGMPLKTVKKDAYLRWAVDAFKLSVSGVQSETSIHTHMCYAEFSDCMQSIADLDTDVNSIENARSGDETIVAFQKIGYANDLGPGVYDIHSPVIPTTKEMVEKLEMFLKRLPATQLIVNPDCGLKTRNWKEVIPALTNMVHAAQILREQHEDNMQM